MMTAPGGRLHAMVEAVLRAMLQVVSPRTEVQRAGFESARIHGTDV